MANNPFGAGNGFGAERPGEAGAQGEPFDALSRRYWQAWRDSLRAAAGEPVVQPDAAAGAQGWQDAVQWWSQLAQAGRIGQGDVDGLLERFREQAQHWFGQMQALAARYAGQDASAAQIAEAWRAMLGGAGGHPFADVFRTMPGQGLQGLEAWIGQAAPWAAAMQQESRSWLSLPAFGLHREHQERQQALARSFVDYQDKSAAFNALLFKAGQQAFALFEARLAECAAPDRQLASVRALFDLWIDAAETAYAEVALSGEFRTAYGAMVNAQMRLRLAMQREVEQACSALGMPTRTEVDAAHRKVADLERQLRKLQAQAGTPKSQGATEDTQADGKARRVKAPSRAAASGKQATSKQTAPKKAVSKQPSSKQKAPKKPMSSRASPRAGARSAGSRSKRA